jgi:transcriptional regulator with XRE-family HTH domain
MDEKERIEKIMLKEGMNSAQFALEIGIQGSTLSHILNGRNKPSLDVLKKILNRFRTLSSDWLILGISPMYRTERNSQMPSLFESVELNDTLSGSSEDKMLDNFAPEFDRIQQNCNVKVQTPLPSGLDTAIIPSKPFETNFRSVRKIIVYYTDNTFQEFESK